MSKWEDLKDTIQEIHDNSTNPDYVSITEYLLNYMSVLSDDESLEKMNICCNCEHYQGVHGCQGYAPCECLQCGVLWNEKCPKYNKYEKSKE